MNRRLWLKTITALIAATGCQRDSSGNDLGTAKFARFGAAESFPTRISLDIGHSGGPANERLCGTNVQWVDSGDGLLQSTGIKFSQNALEKVVQLSPTVIRYPGGSQSDVFNWRAGLGEESARKANEHFWRKDKQIVRFGTAEFLALCEMSGAEPLITVNVGTGTPQDAADWVRATNITGLISPLTGRRLPKVPFWEIGNEPYLKDDKRPETWMDPSEYARRANAFIQAMRKEDATIRVGIPIRSDSFNGIPATPHQGFNQRVLPLIKEPFDFVSLHNAYFPFLYDEAPEDGEIYAGLMGASETVRFDLEATRAQIVKLIGHPVPLAITEYNAMVTLGRRQDKFLSSPAGALYVADLLRLFAEQPDILMANHWSLIGNWEFGALTSSGTPRPVFEVLRMYRSLLHGNMLPLKIQTKGFSAPRMGLMREANDVPVVVGTATINSGKLRLLLLNKHPLASAQTNIELDRSTFGSAVDVITLIATSPFAPSDIGNPFANRNEKLHGGSTLMTLSLPPCSLTLLESQIV